MRIYAAFTQQSSIQTKPDGLACVVPPEFLSSFGGGQMVAYNESRTTICSFSDGPAPVVVRAAPIKRLARMREKIAKYTPPHPRSRWPLTANILDPIRSSVVCKGPRQILQVFIF